jgi:alkyl sulfatase BDS1-like metallo-beta-lactamase superfamily hydrolase
MADYKLTAVQKEASRFTRERQRQDCEALDFSSEEEFEFARRGLIASPESLEIRDSGGNLVWTQKAFGFLEGEAPETVNPSLWRHAKLNHISGLFEVCDGIYQVRGYDITNITFIRGERGWIIFDPAMSVECAAAALALVERYLGKRPVTGIVISHSHTDHYGGIRGVISEDEARRVPIIVPEGFAASAVSETVYAGNAMARRAVYQFGGALEPGPRGLVAVGLGLTTSQGVYSYLEPNDTIKATGERRVIDGVEMIFQMTPGTEAPAEMNTWFPGRKALWLAENCTATLHNLHPVRGALVRDGNAWAVYIMEALALYGGEAEAVFQSHNWPRFGNQTIREYLVNTAAVYKFINDQTLFYLNQGHTLHEIGDMIRLPGALQKLWYARPYYGTVAHNAKAVYQRFMGWYDGNPAHLDALPPRDAAKKYAEYLGGSEAALKRAKEDFEKGEYRWVAEITNLLVFADPSNTGARNLCADAFEQLGYRAESGIWRNAYLTGAKELREGGAAGGWRPRASRSDVIQAMTPAMIFDYLGILIDSSAAESVDLKINFDFSPGLPEAESYLVTIRAGVLLYQRGLRDAEAEVSVALAKQDLAPLFLAGQDGSLPPGVRVTGNAGAFLNLKKYIRPFDPFFNIIEP